MTLLPGGFCRSLVLIGGVLANSKHTAQYTRWNLILLALHRYMGIPVQTVFLNSVTTLVSFQHGATDGTKMRLMDRYHLENPLVFLFADFAGHVVPVIVTATLMCRGPNGHRQRITASHVLQMYTWVVLYYTLVGKGLNCEKQYVTYPWRRQVLASCIVPVATWVLWNRDRKHSSWVASILATLAAFYIRELYDLMDAQPRITCTPATDPVHRGLNFNSLL